jgi:hypothetical protein
MRKLGPLLMVAVALGACGGDPLDLETDDRANGAASETEKSSTTSPEAGPNRGTSPGAETRPAKRRLIYLDARTLCGEFGVRQIVRRFRLEPGSAAAVARAYAERNYSAPFREAGYRGCLAGFRK